MQYLHEMKLIPCIYVNIKKTKRYTNTNRSIKFHAIQEYDTGEVLWTKLSSIQMDHLKI